MWYSGVPALKGREDANFGILSLRHFRILNLSNVLAPRLLVNIGDSLNKFGPSSG
jgi:hypothetical protein